MKTKTLVDKLAQEHGLDETQSRYLSELANEVRELESDQRKAFLEESAELLGERPPQDWDELTDALSEPTSFAAAWLGEQEANSPDKSWSTRLRKPRNLIMLVAAILITTGAGWTYSYFNAEAHIRNNCSGALGPSVERLEAAGQTEFVMPFEVDARYGVWLCVSAWEGTFDPEVNPATRAEATIERVYFANPVSLTVQPVGWEIVDFDSTRGDASQNEPFSTVDTEDGFTNIIVWFEGDRCNVDGGVGIGFGALDVDFTYRGQQRTGRVDLGASYTFMAEEGQCTDAVRANDDALDEAWRSVVDGRLDSFANINTGSVELEQLAVSRDLCRYLRGITSPSNGGDFEIEPLEARTVFQLDPAVAVPLIDGAVLGSCPQFADQRDALVELALDS